MALRVGIVGKRGGAFFAGLRAVEGVEIAALCDLNPAWLAEECAAQGVAFGTASFEEMLERVDAVVVATPMHLHAPQVVAALDAGKHVLSEVTACVRLDECWQILEAVQRSGRTYMLAENYCYLRSNVLVRALVREGLFGDLTYGEGEYLHDVKPYHHDADGRPTWRATWQVGVNGNTYITHSLGPVMQWFKEADPGERVASVVCLGSGRRTDPEHPHDDTSVTLCQLASGKLVRIRLDMMSNRPHQMGYYALQGTRGVFETSRFDGEPARVWFGDNPQPGWYREVHRTWSLLSDYEHLLPGHWRNPPEEARRAGHGGGDYWVVRDWIDACRGERAPAVDVFDALEWTAAGLCSQLSIANGGVPIRVPDFRDASARPLTLS